MALPLSNRILGKRSLILPDLYVQTDQCRFTSNAWYRHVIVECYLRKVGEVVLIQKYLKDRSIVVLICDP